MSLMNVVTDIKNILTEEEFKKFDEEYWENPEETVENLKKTHEGLLLVEENIPCVCSLEGEDYRTPNGVVCVMELNEVIDVDKFKDSVFFFGDIVNVESDVRPSGFCEITIQLTDRVIKTEYEDGIPEDYTW